MTSFGQKVKMWKASDDKILTQRILRWFMEDGELSIPDELLPVLHQLVQDKSNSQRSGRFGASSRGTCRRAQVFSYLGVNGVPHADPQLANIFLDGTWRHIRWQMLGLTQGWFTRVEVKGNLPELRLGTSADAMNDIEAWGFELKGMREVSNIIRNGIPQPHLLQVHTMLLAHDMDTWVYLGEDKQSQQIHEIVVRRDERVIESVTEELQDLNGHISGHTLPPVLPACAGGDGPKFRGCAYRNICLGCEPAAIPLEQWNQPAPVAVRVGRDAGGPAGEARPAD